MLTAFGFLAAVVIGLFAVGGGATSEKDKAKGNQIFGVAIGLVIFALMIAFVVGRYA